MLNLPVRQWISTAIRIESIHVFIVNINKCCSASHILGFSSLVVPSSETKQKDSGSTPAAASFKKFKNSEIQTKRWLCREYFHSMRTQKLPMIPGNHVIFRIGQVGLKRLAKIFFGITFWRSLETRLNSVAKPTEFVPRPLLACVTFFATSLCRHIGVYKKHRRVVNTNSNFYSSIVKNVLRPKVSKYFSVFQPKFSVLLCNFTTYSELSN